MLSVLTLGVPTAAHAQLAGTLELTTNQMFRGETISADDPALTLGVNLEGPAGTFIGASTSVAAGSGDPHIDAATQYAGIATRRGRTSFEAGVIHRTYDRIVDEDYRRGFFEGYVGVTHRGIKARLYVSPDYLRSGLVSYYVEVNARLLAVEQWSLDGHAGLSLIPTETAAGPHKIDDFEDWRLQASRPLGKQLFFSAGLSATNYPVYSASGRLRAFASVLYAF